MQDVENVGENPEIERMLLVVVLWRNILVWMNNLNLKIDYVLWDECLFKYSKFICLFECKKILNKILNNEFRMIYYCAKIMQ